MAADDLNESKGEFHRFLNGRLLDEVTADGSEQMNVQEYDTVGLYYNAALDGVVAPSYTITVYGLPDAGDSAMKIKLAEKAVAGAGSGILYQKNASVDTYQAILVEVSSYLGGLCTVYVNALGRR